jgi:hypothetical protein
LVTITFLSGAMIVGLCLQQGQSTHDGHQALFGRDNVGIGGMRDDIYAVDLL